MNTDPILEQWQHRSEKGSARKESCEDCAFTSWVGGCEQVSEWRTEVDTFHPNHRISRLRPHHGSKRAQIPWAWPSDGASACALLSVSRGAAAEEGDTPSEHPGGARRGGGRRGR